MCGIQHSFPQTNVVHKLRVAIGYPPCHAHQVSSSADQDFSSFQRCCSCCCGAPVSTRRSGSSFGNVLPLLSCHACVLPCIALKFICSFHPFLCTQTVVFRRVAPARGARKGRPVQKMTLTRQMLMVDLVGAA